MKDKVKITDDLLLNGRPVGGATLKSLWENEREPVCITGYFSMLCRERGKLVPGTAREGKNIWTLTGREYLAQLMSLSVLYPTNTPFRTDHIAYVAFGRGTQPEVASVSSMREPVAYNDSGDMLAQWAIPTFPLAPSRTTVRYARSFSETELSVQGTVPLNEAGLFSDGNPDNNWEQRTIPDELRLAACRSQAPMAYKSFETLKKTQNFVLEVAWEVRF